MRATDRPTRPGWIWIGIAAVLVTAVVAYVLLWNAGRWAWRALFP